MVPVGSRFVKSRNSPSGREYLGMSRLADIKKRFDERNDLTPEEQATVYQLNVIADMIVAYLGDGATRTQQHRAANHIQADPYTIVGPTGAAISTIVATIANEYADAVELILRLEKGHTFNYPWVFCIANVATKMIHLPADRASSEYKDMLRDVGYVLEQTFLSQARRPSD